ncbi:MAG TPA: 3'-5' exonuclease [Thermoanaerobaculia bacterium]|nr:3'-5' exonuclease [Thermoanaerobaculia bacterium]
MFRRQLPPPNLLAADFETTGLDPRRDAIVAAGLVPLRAGTILWGERFYTLIADPRLQRPRDPEALAVHQILPAETEGGATLGDLLASLRAALDAGSVLLAHGASIERKFLAAAARHQGEPEIRPAWLDTLDFLRSIDRHRTHLASRLPAAAPRHASIPTVLAEARAFFGLPAYPAHHALYDALGTAELYLLLAGKFPELHPRVGR